MVMCPVRNNEKYYNYSQMPISMKKKKRTQSDFSEKPPKQNLL